MLSSIIKTALLLAGVAQADFVMMRFLAPADTKRPESVREGYYFKNLTDAEVASHSWPDIRDVSRLYPLKDSVSEPYNDGVVINEGAGGLSQPDRVEVFWGQDEGHWTVYGNHHGGNKPYDIIDTKGFNRGHCNMKFNPKAPVEALDNGSYATVWAYAWCTSSYFHPPIELFAARDLAADTAN